MLAADLRLMYSRLFDLVDGTTLGCVLAVVLAVCAPKTFASDQRVMQTGMVLERQSVGGAVNLNKSLDDFEVQVVDGELRRVFKFQWSHPTQYLRIVLEDLRLGQNQKLTLNSPLLEPVDVLDGPFGGLAGQAYYSPIVPGSLVEIVLSGDNLDSASLTVKTIAFQKKLGNVKSIFGKDDREPVANFPGDKQINSTAKSVAFISILNQHNHPTTCSGFLINDQELLTNKHCFFSPEQDCQKTAILFNYNKTLANGIAFRCEKVTPEHGVVGDAIVLDYAIVRLDKPVSGEIPPIALHTSATFGLPETEDPNNPVEPSSKIDGFLVHHPAGEPKQVSKTNCRVYYERVIGAFDAADFRHRCDTLKGSSGSPVLTVLQPDQGLPLACAAGLHHAAFASVGSFMSYNRAVLMPLIADKLEENGISFSPCAK